MTDGMSDAASVAFDRNGKYLYFIASTDDGPAIASSMGSFKVPVTGTAYVIVLRKDLKSPLAPQSDEEKVTADKSAAKEAKPAETDDCKPEGEGKPEEAAAGEKPAKEGDKAADKKDEKKDEKKRQVRKKNAEVKIDFDNINQRILSLPVPARNYDHIVAGKTHALYLLERPQVDLSSFGHQLHKFDVCTRKIEKVLDNVGGFLISANAEKALYEQLPPANPLVGPGDGEPAHGRGSSSLWMRSASPASPTARCISSP